MAGYYIVGAIKGGTRSPEHFPSKSSGFLWHLSSFTVWAEHCQGTAHDLALPELPGSF